MKNLIFTTAGLLALLASTTISQVPMSEDCYHQVSREIVIRDCPLKLSVPATRPFQDAAEYRQSYLFRNSFEDGLTEPDFNPGFGTAWLIEEGRAKNGQLMATFDKERSAVAGSALVQDPGNWLVLGPFDLSRSAEAHFNFYIQLGLASTKESASLQCLISSDGKTFRGYRFSGMTCGWLYCNIDLRNDANVGNLCGKGCVWIAIVPESPPSSPAGDISLDYLRLLSTDPQLPPEHVLPSPTMRESATSHQDLLEHYAPYIRQSLVGELYCYEFGDYITRFDYDGDYNAFNNWDNLAHSCLENNITACNGATGCVQTYDLPAYVYSSAIETPTHFFLCYGLFHPTDDFYCHLFHHENDLEGIMMMVQKTGSEYGELRLVQLMWHKSWYQYTPAGYGGDGIYDRFEDIDGVIPWFAGSHPVVDVEGGGHGIDVWPDTLHGRCIHYFPMGVAEIPSPSDWMSTGDPYAISDEERVSYKLIPIPEEFWQRRAPGSVFAVSYSYEGRRMVDGFHVENLGSEFGGNSCMGGWIIPQIWWDYNAAHSPWAWNHPDDNCNDVYPCQGDWFMDPAMYHRHQFLWDEPVSTDYTFHPYVHNDIGGSTYGSLNNFASPPEPYHVVYNLSVGQNQHLTIDPGVNIEFYPQRSMIADGVIIADAGGSAIIRMVRTDDPTIGIKLYNRIRLSNGGGIKFSYTVGGSLD